MSITAYVYWETDPSRCYFVNKNLQSKPDIVGNVAFLTSLVNKQLLNGVNRLVFVIAKQEVFSVK